MLLMIATLLTLQETRKFPVQGQDLMDGAEIQNVTKIGPNFKLENSSKLVIKDLPEKMQSGSYQVKIHVLPIANGFSVDFRKLVNGQTFSWPVEFAGGQWSVKSATNTLSMPATLSKWVDIVFYVVDDSTTDHGVTTSHRHLDISVDGKFILRNGEHTGKLDNFTFQTSDQGSVVIGGVELLSGKLKK